MSVTVACVKTFIAILSKKNLSDIDEDLLRRVKNKFAFLSEGEVLNADQLAFLLQIFDERFKAVVDKDGDPTWNAGGNNKPWTLLAQNLSKELKSKELKGKTYLNILMPDVTNSLDPFFLSRLDECKVTDAFFLGDDGMTLYRVRGLFENLLKNEPLSTFDSKDKTKIRALSLRELMRIRSKTGNLCFDFNQKMYVNFWDYLQQEIIPGWKNCGELPKRDVLVSLLKVIEFYFLTGQKNDDLTPVSELLLTWSKQLLSCAVNDVNRLYGQSILVDGEPVSLLNILLDCLQHKRANLGKQLYGVAHWLCHHDSSLISECPALGRKYPKLTTSQSEPTISNDTVKAVRELVGKTVHPYAHAHTEAELAAVERAYLEFYAFLMRMGIDEQWCLYSQQIVFAKRKISVARLMSSEECASVRGQFLAQMVVNYAPESSFEGEGLSKDDIKTMQENRRLQVRSPRFFSVSCSLEANPHNPRNSPAFPGY